MEKKTITTKAGGETRRSPRPEIVIPAKAGTHPSAVRTVDKWVPAFAGMTTKRECLDRVVGALGRGHLQILRVLRGKCYGPFVPFVSSWLGMTWLMQILSRNS